MERCPLLAWQEGFEPPAPLSRKPVFSRDVLSPVQALPQKMALGPGLEPGWVLRRRRISNAVPYHFRTAKQMAAPEGLEPPWDLWSPSGFRPDAITSSTTVPKWRGVRDSNPRVVFRPTPHFQCGTFDQLCQLLVQKQKSLGGQPWPLPGELLKPYQGHSPSGAPSDELSNAGFFALTSPVTAST